MSEERMAQKGSIKGGITSAYPELFTLYQYAERHTLRLHPVQEKLIERTASVPRSAMLSDSAQMQFLQNIVRTLKAKKTLDVGVFTGYSALSIALALPDDGKVVALDISEEYTSVGKPFWKEAGVEHKIDLRIKPALESLQELVDNGESGTFDYAYIDADKEGYDAYYEHCLKLLRPGGVIAFDNTIRSGRVLEEDSTDPSIVALRALAVKLHKDERIHVSMLVLGDGTTLAFKK